MPSGSRHYRITLADALSAHDRALLTGGRPGIHAALLQSIATNHAFNDGNKRTSIILLDLLLDRSGYRLDPADKTEDIESALEDFVVERVVKDKASAEAIAQWLGLRIVRLRTSR